MKLTKATVIFLLGILILSVVACNGGSAEPTPTPTAIGTQLKSYSNDYFSVRYPSRWQLEVLRSTPDNLYVQIYPDWDYVVVSIDFYPGEESEFPPLMERELWSSTLADTCDGFVLLNEFPPQEKWDWVMFYEYSFNIQGKDEWFYGWSAFKFESDFMAIINHTHIQDNTEMGNECNRIVNSIEFY